MLKALGKFGFKKNNLGEQGWSQKGRGQVNNTGLKFRNSALVSTPDSFSE